mgnify:CR=1 FL=1|tara:strand:- start:258 stop:590 length:333 start_codon:yes stop_codon:yes gene_type:complete
MEENKIFISLGVLAAVGYGYYAWNKSRKNDLALRAVENDCRINISMQKAYRTPEQFKKAVSDCIEASNSTPKGTLTRISSWASSQKDCPEGKTFTSIQCVNPPCNGGFCI